MTFLFSLALAAQCQQYSVRCDCAPAVPFEGFQISVVETCDGKEAWWTQYGQRQFTTVEDCQAAIPSDPVCQKLPNSSQ